MANGPVSDLVEWLAAVLLPRRRVRTKDAEPFRVAPETIPYLKQEGIEVEDATADELAAAPDVREVIPFLGFRGGAVERPGGSTFRMVYLDVGFQDWLLVEDDGIHDYADVEDKSVPGEKRQVLWVDINAAIGRGHGPQSVEARFLTGEFTRAGDFEAPVTGGTAEGARTGVFCEARTPSCCRYPSRPPRPH